MNRHTSRRRFLQNSALLGGTLAFGLPYAWADRVKSSSPAAEKLGWRIGLAQYTFRRFSFFETLDLAVKLGISCIEPDFFLPLDKARPKLLINEDLSPELRKEVKQRLADRGLTMASFYANLGADAERAKKIFEFSKEMGAKAIVAEPPVAAFDMIEKLCDEHDIDLAIHNHPKPSSAYWNPDAVVAACKGRGKHIGACCDTGHWVRSGLDTVECLKKLEGRIRGFHLKDVIASGKPEARDVPLGEGKGNYRAILAELKRQGYRGVLGIEYEHDSPQLMEDVAKCVAFVEQTAKKLEG